MEYVPSDEEINAGLEEHYRKIRELCGLDYVSKETAYGLYKLGFPQEDFNKSFVADTLKFSDSIIDNIGLVVVIPTMYEVVKWLRNVFNIEVTVHPIYCPNKNYTVAIDYQKRNEGLTSSYVFGTYEKALEAGIKHTIRLIQQRQALRS